MAVLGDSCSSVSGGSAQSNLTGQPIVVFGHRTVTDPGMGFENLPPRAISTCLFKWLKCVDLKSAGLGLDCVPFNFGWKLEVWNPNSAEESVDLESLLKEFDRICDELEMEDATRVKILKICDIVVEQKPESVAPQVEGKKEEHNIKNAYVEILDVCDEFKEEKSEVFGPQIELDLAPLFDAAEEVCMEEIETGADPDLDSGVGVSNSEKIAGECFEGEVSLEKPSQPSSPTPDLSKEQPLPAEPRKRRFKTLAGRTDLPWLRKLRAQQPKPNPPQKALLSPQENPTD